MQERAYITTAIPYVNARPHIGFARELVIADCVARSQRLLGRSARLQTGTDENAFKNVQAARAAGEDTAALVGRHAAAFRALGATLQAEVDAFVRTSESRHHQAVHRLWGLLRPDDLYRRRYRGLYCAGCEDFYLARDLDGGRCPVHATEPAAVEEENVFFRLSRYQEPIEGAIQSGRLRIEPRSRRAEVLAFVRRGLRDISVSRQSARVGGWGVPLPGDAGQRVYVWIDALVNYLTGLEFGSDGAWQTWWGEGARIVHVIGKDVWKFHACYWPGLLLSAGLPLPDTLLVHGFLTQEGQKISKSRGAEVGPEAYVERYGADALRYALLKIPVGEDGDFSEQSLGRVYQTDLADGLGNLCRRITALAARADYAGGPADPAAWPEVEAELAAYRLDRALLLVWREIGALNRDIDRQKPWVALRQGGAVASEEKALQENLRRWLAGLRRLAFWLGPFLPQAAARIETALTRRPLAALPPLFPKIEAIPTKERDDGSE